MATKSKKQVSTKPVPENPILTERVIKNGRVIGWFAAVKIGDDVFIGHSKHNKIDPYDAVRGKTIAIKRAQKGTVAITNTLMSFSLENHLPAFEERCKRYFKDYRAVMRPFIVSRHAMQAKQMERLAEL